MSYLAGSTQVSVDVFFADDEGMAVIGKVAADFPECKWSSGTNTLDTAITLSDLALLTTAHPNNNVAGGIKEREGGWYRLDVPNNVFSTVGVKQLTFDETTDKRILARPIIVVPNNVTVGSFGSSALQQLGNLGTIRVETPTVTESEITIRQGDDYLEVDDRALSFINPQGTWPSLAGASCILEFIVNDVNVECEAGTVVTAVGLNQRVDVDVPSSISSQLNYSVGRFELTATLSGGSVVTLRTGTLNTILNN